MKKDSTQTGEEIDQTTEETEYHDPNAEAREAIAARRRQELRDEGVDIPDDDESDEVDESEEDEETPEGKTETEPEDKPEPAEEMVEIKVDGEVEKVKQSEVDAAGGIRALQKERAADKRLQEAARRDKELREREAALVEREKGLQQPTEDKTGAEATEPPPAPLDKKALVELVNKIQYGDADEAAEAMEKIMASQQKGSPPPKEVDTQQIVAQVRADLRGEEVLKRFVASPEDGGFGDLQDTRFAKIPTTLGGKVYTLPAPLAVARQEVDRLIAEEHADPFAWETYEKAGKFAREQFGLQTKDNPTHGNSAKHERKRKSAHIRGTTPPADKKPDVEKSIKQSRREGINEIMEARNRGAA